MLILKFFKRCIAWIGFRGVDPHVDYHKAVHHAILALAYWQKCTKTNNVQFNCESSTKYVRLGNNYNER